MNVQLDPRDKERIKDLARESGKEPDELLRELVHEALESREQGDRSRTTDLDDAKMAWNAFLAATSERSRSLPEDYHADDSRESIYAGRGE